MFSCRENRNDFRFMQRYLSPLVKCLQQQSCSAHASFRMGHSTKMYWLLRMLMLYCQGSIPFYFRLEENTNSYCEKFMRSQPSSHVHFQISWRRIHSHLFTQADQKSDHENLYQGGTGVTIVYSSSFPLCKFQFLFIKRPFFPVLPTILLKDLKKLQTLQCMQPSQNILLPELGSSSLTSQLFKTSLGHLGSSMSDLEEG